jgi:glycosyltransferase involved in cell wall biosynthesis
MRIVLWGALIAIFYTYLGYPIAVGLWARWRGKPWKRGALSPSVSIIMAVHNGRSLLPWKIRHLTELDYPNIKEIIIISDGSTDGTAEFLRAHDGERVKALILEEHKGKAAALNAGLAHAHGELALFVDIRPEIAPGAIHALVSNFLDRRVGCATGNLILRQQGQDGTAHAVGDCYWRYEQWLRSRESMIDSTVGVYGGFYAVRRKLAVMQPDGLILDDMYQPLSIIRHGYRSVVDERAIVIDSWPHRRKEEFGRKVRTLAGNFQLVQRASWILTRQNRCRFQLISHKGMRLIVPYLFVLLFATTLWSAGSSSFYAAFSLLQILGWSIAVAGLYLRLPVLHKVASAAGALLLLNLAAVVGLYRFLFAPRPLQRIWVSGRS